MTDDELYRCGTETVLASWEAYASGSGDATLKRLPAVVAAVFPGAPERSVYNNAILECHVSAPARAAAVAALEDVYAEAGIPRFAAWVHESDEAMRADLERRGYTLDTTTRAMGMALDALPPPSRDVELGSIGWDEYLRTFGLPDGLLGDADLTPFHLLLARVDGKTAATAMAFDHGGDCGIYNVATLAPFRRRGLGTALTSLHLHAARARGCRTASLQSTEAAERVYAGVGFRDLGRILEYAPPEAPAQTSVALS